MSRYNQQQTQNLFRSAKNALLIFALRIYEYRDLLIIFQSSHYIITEKCCRYVRECGRRLHLRFAHVKICKILLRYPNSEEK